MRVDGELTIVTGDNALALRDLDDGVFDLVVTSPPYDDLRAYGEHKWDFRAVAAELWRTLKPGGVLCWNVGDSVDDEGSETVTSAEQKVHFRKGLGFVVHDTMIYERANFSVPERVRYHQMFEYVFVLSKGRPATFNPIRDKRNATAGATTLGVNRGRHRDGSMTKRRKFVVSEMGMRGNVWRGPTRGQEDFCKGLPHPAMMPKWLARDLVLSWSNPGDLVGDPFAGSGTVGMVSIESGRRAWACDANPAYRQVMERYTRNATPGFQL